MYTRLQRYTIRGFYVLLPLIGSCSVGREIAVEDHEARPAADTPGHFMVSSIDSEAPVEPAGASTCISPMVDPRNQVRVYLVRSRAGRGDYEVSEGRYGVGQGELLRIDCPTGRVIGIVPR